MCAVMQLNVCSVLGAVWVFSLVNRIEISFGVCSVDGSYVS